jgi:alkylation response protein AidB-like acyl-CoA dehydrogenase
MRTALDLPPERLDPDEREFVAAIREHGWFATHVREEEGLPGFSYTTGFWLRLGQPEIVVFALPRTTIHDILWDIFRGLEGGAQWPERMPVAGVLGNADAAFFRVAGRHYAEHLGWSRWFYGGDDFPCLQLVWPDRSNLFPWEPGFDPSMLESQPDLSEQGWGFGRSA